MALRGEGLRSGVTGGTDGDGSGDDAAGGSGRSVRSVSDGMGWRREGLGAGPGFIGREVRGPRAARRPTNAAADVSERG